MKGTSVSYVCRTRIGFTVLELIVVLSLLALSAAIVAPSLISSPPERLSEIRALASRTRDQAVRRGETVRLRIERSGSWQAFVGAPPNTNLLMSGQLADPPGSVTDLSFSPLGACAPSVEAAAAATLQNVDLLTCEWPPS